MQTVDRMPDEDVYQVAVPFKKDLYHLYLRGGVETVDPAQGELDHHVVRGTVVLGGCHGELGQALGELVRTVKGKRQNVMQPLDSHGLLGQGVRPLLLHPLEVLHQRGHRLGRPSPRATMHGPT